MTYDTSFHSYKITVNLTPAVYQYKFMVDSNWFPDPNNPVSDGSQYGNSQITIADPMITYFWPMDTVVTTIANIKPLKAIFAFNSQTVVNISNITLKINGISIALSSGNYNSVMKMFTYSVNSGDVVSGRNIVNLSITTPGGTKTRNAILNISNNPTLEYLTEHTIYKRASIVLYGKIGNDQITNFRMDFNGAILQITPNADNTFAYPVTLIPNNNIVKMTLTSTTGVTEITDTLIYKPETQPVLDITSTVNGRSLSSTVTAVSPNGLPMTYSWYEGPWNPVKLLAGNETGSGMQVTIPNVKGEYIYKVRVTDSEGNYNIVGCLIKANSDSLHIMGSTEHSSWIDSLVMYELFTPTFGQNQKGLKGVIEKMDHIADLGVNAIWMTPVFDGDSLHGYSTRDYYKINAAFGTANDLKSIVQSAHSKGIRVILDLVINHTWSEHPFFKNAVNLKTMSPFANYYLWTGTPGNSTYSYYYDWTNLPNLNVVNPEVSSYLINMAAYWVREYDIDGYRCDVAWGIEQRNSTMWKNMRKELRKIKPEIYLLAESPADNSFEGHTLDIFNNKFDAAYDWNFMGFGAGAIYSALNGAANIPALNTVLTKTYPANSYPMRFIENHDISRAASQFGIPKSKLGHTVMMTANGIPLIYGGAEVGELTQRNKINWSDPNNLNPYFKRLVQIKKKYILNNAAVANLQNSIPNSVYSYLTKSDSNVVLTLANFSGSANTVTVNFANQITSDSHTITDLFQNNSVVLTLAQLNAYSFSLAANESKVFLIDGTPLDVKNSDGKESVLSFELFQNYPNPFNPTTAISYQVPNSGFVTLKVYDVLGREVRMLVNEEKTAGTYTANFSAGNLASGLYFYTLRAGNFNSTKKMLLVK